MRSPVIALALLLNASCTRMVATDDEGYPAANPVQCDDPAGCGFRFWEDCNDQPVCECGPACSGRPVQIVAGMSHTCLRYDTGGLQCWGMIRGVNSDPSMYRWDQGAYAGPNQARRPAVTSPAGLDDVVDVVAGNFHTCAVRSDGTVWCWGRNDQAQLGFHEESDSEEHKVPLQVAGLVAQGVCGGDYPSALLGAGRSVVISLPRRAEDDVYDCGGGSSFACYVRADKTVLCYGDNFYGTLGDGTGDYSDSAGYAIPKEVLSDVEQVDGGFSHACARRSNGELWCWGSGAGVGVSPITDAIEPPRRVAGIGAVTDFAVEGFLTCAIEVGGQLYCWGGDGTQIFGTGNSMARVPTPTPIPGEAHTRDIALASDHGCVIRENDEVACWGDSSTGATGPRPPTVASGRLQTLEDLSK